MNQFLLTRFTEDDLLNELDELNDIKPLEEAPGDDPAGDAGVGGGGDLGGGVTDVGAGDVGAGTDLGGGDLGGTDVGAIGGGVGGTALTGFGGKQQKKVTGNTFYYWNIVNTAYEGVNKYLTLCDFLLKKKVIRKVIVFQKKLLDFKSVLEVIIEKWTIIKNKDLVVMKLNEILVNIKNDFITVYNSIKEEL